MEPNSKKTCKLPGCGKELEEAHGNREYCSAGHKSRAAAEKAKGERIQISAVMLQLRKNWRVLKNFFAHGKLLVTEAELLYKGFHFSYCSSFKQVSGLDHVIPEYFSFTLSLQPDGTFKISKLW
jgi:hypothetical protein